MPGRPIPTAGKNLYYTSDRFGPVKTGTRATNNFYPFDLTQGQKLKRRRTKRCRIELDPVNQGQHMAEICTTHKHTGVLAVTAIADHLQARLACQQLP